MGMVGLVVVGDAPVDKAAILGVKLPKKPRGRIEAMLAQLP